MTIQADWAQAALDAGMASAQWRALGCSVHLVVTDATALRAARHEVERELERMDQAASRFREDSELSGLNRNAGTWVTVGPALAEALAAARAAAQWSDGLVDPTVGLSLISLGYDRTFTSLISTDAPLSVSVSPAIGWQCLELDGDRARIPSGVRLDLGATAKGLASDRCARAVETVTGTGVLVSLGGDIAVAGATPLDGWPVLVSDHSDGPLTDLPGGAGQVICLHRGGLATSGTQARRWSRGGSVFHHLIDPRSGLPTTGRWRTVSVVADTCLDANTASTSAIVLGATALSWLRTRGFTARLVAHDGEIVYVGGWPQEQTS